MDGTLQTALSPNVRRLVTQIGVHNEHSTLQFLSSSRIICWESLNQVLPGNTVFLCKPICLPVIEYYCSFS